MISAWTKNCKSVEEKEQFQNKLLGSKVILERIQELMAEELSAVETDEINVSSYDNANWAYRQAHRNGYKNAVRKLNILLDLKENNVDRQPTQSRPG